MITVRENYSTEIPKVELPDSYSNRQHEMLHFSSGLKCYLVSDPSTNLVTVAATIGCGSLHDPQNVPGLAHLCEHVVFSGDAQRPLHKLVTEAGGSVSACTSFDQTSFALEVSSYAPGNSQGSGFILESLLPCFASLLFRPKFSKEAISREINSVNEEHAINTSKVDKILWQGLKLLAHKSHPFNKFATGNLQTLSKHPKKNLKTKLEEHHANFFSPENTAVVLKGPQSINHLRKLLRVSFAAYIDGDGPSNHPLCIDLPTNAFRHCDPNTIIIKSNSCTKARLCFPLGRSVELSSTTKHLLCNLLGNESNDTFCCWLKRNQLARSILVFSENITSFETILIIDMDLTKLGWKRIRLVLAVFFHYIENVVGKLSDSDLLDLITEYKLVGELQLKSQQPPQSFLDETLLYSEKLQAKGTITEENQNDFKILEALRVQFSSVIARKNLKLQLVTSSFTCCKIFPGQWSTQSRDNYYGFEYVTASVRFDEDMLSPRMKSTVLKIPPPLGDLKTQVQMLLNSSHGNTSTRYRGYEGPLTSPSAHYIQSGLRVWTQSTSTNGVIEVSSHIKFDSLSVEAETLTGLELIVAIIGEKLKVQLYNLETVGCTWGIYANINGLPSILITTSGKIPLAMYIMETCLKELSNFILSKRYMYCDIKRARVLLREKYREYIECGGVKMVYILGYRLFDEGIILPEARMEALEIFDQKSLSTFSDLVSKAHKTNTLYFSGDTASVNINSLTEWITLTGDDKHVRGINYELSSFVLPRGKSYILQKEGPAGDPLEVVFFYIQIGVRSDIRSFTLAKLLSLLISTSIFDNLRNKRQLAYGVFSGMKLFRSSFGIHITIPTSKYGCEYVVEQIEEYLLDLENQLKLFSDEHHQALIDRLLESLQQANCEEQGPTSLFASLEPLHGSDSQCNDPQHDTHWSNLNQILNGTYNFGGIASEERIDIDFLKNTSRQQFLEFVLSKVSMKSSNRSVVAICKSSGAVTPLARLHMASKTLAHMLRGVGLNMQEELVLEELQKCKDKVSFSDLSLGKHFPQQQLEYKIFKIKLRLGGIIEKLNSKPPKTKHSIKTYKREIFHEVEDLQKLCCLAN